MREALVKLDLLEAVIGLGPGLFYNAPMEAVIVVLRSRKPANRRNNVLFINALHEVARAQAQSFLREEHQKKILSAYEGYESIEGFATVATHEEIAAKGYSLSIPLYVKNSNSPIEEERLTVDEAVEVWRTACGQADHAMDEVIRMLREEVTK